MQKGGSHPLTPRLLPSTEPHLNTAMLGQQAESDERAWMEETLSSLAVRKKVQATSS